MNLAEERLTTEAARRYLRAGVGPWLFASFKLRTDPVYKEILRQGILPSRGRILDVGCGLALALSLIRSAQLQYARANFPRDWPPPPEDVELCGLDLRVRQVSIARRALSGEASIEPADIRHVTLPRCRAALLLDVLHYLGPQDQENLLAEIGRVLESGGTIVIREADSNGGKGFQAVRFSERVRAHLRGQFRQGFHYRSAEDWERQIAKLGFVTSVQKMAAGTPFANVMVLGHRSRDQKEEKSHK